MAKKKREEKDVSGEAVQEAGAEKAVETRNRLHLSPETIESLFTSTKIPTYRFSATIPPLKFAVPKIEPTLFKAFPTVFRVGIPSTRERELEDEIDNLRKDHWRLMEEFEAKTKTARKKGTEIEELKKNIEELNRKQRLQHLLGKVNESARDKLLESEEFRNLFEEAKICNAVIMSVDIRRSTELMLKAREPHLFADFITSLCFDLTSIILDNYGVFDKFTGDGVLAFFPEFYSGKDAPYWAIKAADECHRCFSMHYQRERSCFKSILLDVGLGIGIDYGESHLVKIQDGLTVIGTPVVYACRMSGTRAGQTLLNQPAYEVISQRFGQYVNFQESEIDMKHEGRTLAYIATLSESSYEPKLPDWIKPPASRKS